MWYTKLYITISVILQQKGTATLATSDKNDTKAQTTTVRTLHKQSELTAATLAPINALADSSISQDACQKPTFLHRFPSALEKFQLIDDLHRPDSGNWTLPRKKLKTATAEHHATELFAIL